MASTSARERRVEDEELGPVLQHGGDLGLPGVGVQPHAGDVGFRVPGQLLGLPVSQVDAHQASGVGPNRAQGEQRAPLDGER